jgi:exodeoxyribonuclease III
MPTQCLISWNVNGLRAIAKKGAFDWFVQTQPDIFCIQETKAHPDQLAAELKTVAGYHSYFAAAERKGYSGVAIYSKAPPQQVVTGFGLSQFDGEGRIVIATYPQFTLCNIYFPNGKASPERLQYKMDFYAAFLDYVEGLRKQGQHIVICGDVNTAHQAIDLARPKENEKVSGFLPMERAWIDQLVSHGYVDTFRLFHQEPGQYTWWDQKSGARTRNVGWRIDYFFVNAAIVPQVTQAEILPDVTGSDHCPISLELTFP